MHKYTILLTTGSFAKEKIPKGNFINYVYTLTARDTLISGMLKYKKYASFLLFSCQVMSDSFESPWTGGCQAPLSRGFPRQEYWSGQPFPSPGDHTGPGTEPTSPGLAGKFFATKSPGKSSHMFIRLDKFSMFLGQNPKFDKHSS